MEIQTLADARKSVETEQFQTMDSDIKQMSNGESMTVDSDDELDDEDIDGFDNNSRSIDNFSEIDNFEFDDDLGISMENKNTQRKTDTDIRILITYLRSINELKPPETVPPLELDRYLSTFFSIVKKHDGNEYEPASLRGMLCSVERYLKMKNYPASVTRDLIFANTRHALKLKQQKLREIGKGSKKPAEPFGKVTLEKVDQLFAAREMGPYTPMSVINTLCFVFIVHFRLRKAIDHKNLLWGDIRVKLDENGKEYLQYEPLMMQPQESTKTENNSNREKPANLCVFAKPDSPERDPVGIYKLYAEKRPTTMQYDSSPFYLGITTLHPTAMQAWYRTCAMGVNKLSDLVRMIRDITGLPRATLNAPAESLLAESYATNTFIKSDITYPLPASSRMYTPILPKTSDIALRLSKPVLQRHSAVDLDDDCENSDMSSSPVFMTAKSPKSQNEMLSECSSRPASSASSPAINPFTDTMYLDLESAKSQINEMLQKMDLAAIVEFDKWLKRIKISRDPKTGKVVCKENKTTDPQGNPDTDSKLEACDMSKANITLNISLSPQSILGKEPITVTATSDLTSLHKPVIFTAEKENGKEQLPAEGKSDKFTMAPHNCSKIRKIIHDSIATKDSTSDQDTIPAKRPRSSGSVPVNLSNKPSSNTSDLSLQTTSDGAVRDGAQTVATIIATAKSADNNFARNCNTVINNPQIPSTRLNSSVLTPSLMSSLTSAPQAHASFLQRLPDREGGLLMPFPIAYGGQKYYTRDNLMLPGQAIFASLSHLPVSAHANYISQNYPTSTANVGSADTTQQTSSGDSIGSCMKTEPS